MWMMSSCTTTSAPASCTYARRRAWGGATSASIASAWRSCARSFKRHADRLMVGGAVGAVDGDAAKTRRQILGNEDVVAAVRRLSFVALVHAEGVRMRRAGIERLPGVDEHRRAVDERLEEARAQRILGRQIEVAADERARRAPEAPVRSFLLAAGGFGVSFAVQLAQALDLRCAVPARVVLEMRGDDAQRTPRRVDHRFERRARHGRRIAPRPWQRVAQYPADRQSRSDEVAEPLAAAVRTRLVDGGGEEHLVAA